MKHPEDNLPPIKYYRCPICDAVLDSHAPGWVFAIAGHRRKHEKADPSLTKTQTEWVRV